MSKIANDNPLDEAESPIPLTDNMVLPFQLESSGVRGRLVRLGASLNDILSAHNYPEAVSHIMAETVLLTTLLSSMLKYEGVFTLQTSSKGAVRTLVSDMTSDGAIRGHAGFRVQELQDLSTANNQGRYDGFTLSELMGDGYVAFTVDQGDHTERYQGIVSLEGDTLGQAIRHYFDQSEQIGTSLHIHIDRLPNGDWRGGGLLLQRLPEDERFDLTKGITSIAENGREEREEDWNRAVILAETVTKEELTSEAIKGDELLVRLFHEEGVRVFDPQAIYKSCRCSRERVNTVLLSLSEEERIESANDGVIDITCEFCSHSYSFNLDELS